MGLDRLIRMTEVEIRTGLDRSTIYRRVKTDEFPKPVRLGVRRVAWRESEVADWQASRPVGVGAKLTRG